MFAVSLLSLFGYHIYLISQNRTTLEAFRPPFFRSGGSDRKGFFLGKGNNFREVLGDRPALWFVPVFTSLGDGLTYPRQGGMDEEEGYSDGYESGDHHAGMIHRQLNRRFQSLNTHEHGSSDEQSDVDDDENVLLLPPKKPRSWQENEQQRSEQAETSPDSLADDVRFSDYSTSKFSSSNGGAHLNQ